MLVHTLFLYTTREILVTDVLGSGVITNDWQCYNENEVLLWTTNTRFYYLARAGVAWASLNSVSIVRLEIYISDPKSGKPSSEDAKKIIFEKNW